MIILCLLIVTIIALYCYNVFILDKSYTDNLLRTISIVAILTMALIRSLYKRRKSLNFYEKAYDDVIYNAFSDKPLLRNKLLCACRLYDEENYNKALKYLYDLLNKAEGTRDASPVLMFIALCYTDVGLYEEAAHIYYQMLQYDPNNSRIHSNMGNLYINLGDYDMAIQHFDKSIEQNSNNYYAYNNRAQCYFRMHDFENAISDAESALKIKQNGVEAAKLLVIIYSLLGDTENKEKYYHISLVSGAKPDDLTYAIEHFSNELNQETSEDNPSEEDDE